MLDPCKFFRVPVVSGTSFRMTHSSNRERAGVSYDDRGGHEVECSLVEPSLMQLPSQERCHFIVDVW